MENKNHWYDGLIYDKLIAPFQDSAFKEALKHIEKGSTLLDVGTGTGRFSFQAAKICKEVIGIDLSSRNIEVAINNLKNSEFQNIKFVHNDVINYLQESNRKFDYITMSYVIHEINKNERDEIIKAISNASEKFILIEFLHPRPKHIRSLTNELVEFFAGAEHYRNFKSFIADGGSIGLALRNNLKIIEDIRNNPISSHILITTK